MENSFLQKTHIRQDNFCSSPLRTVHALKKIEIYSENVIQMAEAGESNVGHHDGLDIKNSDVRSINKTREKGDSDMEKTFTVHTRRTIMFAELSKVMDFSIQEGDHRHALSNNIIGKSSGYNKTYTNKLLVALYKFDRTDASFLLFEHFWKICRLEEKPILTILYALQRDFLLRESIDIVRDTRIGEKVSIERLEENITSLHDSRFAKSTLRSTSQNLASSWKQAGFIVGKVKNVRTQPAISSTLVAFAFALAYLNGERGDFILSSKWAKALCLGESQLREFAIEAARRDLLQYQYAGSVTSVSFTNLFTKLRIDGVEN